MSVLVDTNILVRTSQPHHPQCTIAIDAVAKMLSLPEELYLVPQNLYEFWVVCTRPLAQNGLGFSVEEAHAELKRVRGLFILLDDGPSIYGEWERLVVHHQVFGKSAHDVRLVAAMMVHGINRLLTFNGGDFQRYPGITVLSPPDVLASKPSQP